MFFATSSRPTTDPGVSIGPFQPADLPGLVAFLNRALADQRHWAPISEDDFRDRVLNQPAFDPAGLILARADGHVVGGVHAIRPPALPLYDDQEPRHFIAWLAVDPDCRQSGIGGRLLQAAEDHLYYCPVYFASKTTPFYGITECLWVPWYGSTEHMAVSAIHDKALVEWLAQRSYVPTDPGDVSLAALLHTRQRPPEPGLDRLGLRCVAISERSPWQGDEPFYLLRRWGRNGGRPYHGLVIADGDRAVGDIVWYPLPDGVTCAVAWLGIERQYRSLRFGSYLLDRALCEMAHGGYLYVEAHVHSRRQVEALALFKGHGFQVIDYWVNLVKT